MSREDLPKVDARRDADGVMVFTVAPGVRPEDLIRALSAFLRVFRDLDVARAWLLGRAAPK